MIVYRITREEFAHDLSGTGSKINGGRWNSEGYFALYTSENRSLALLENLVHTPFVFLQKQSFLLLELSIPPKATYQQIQVERLDKNWDDWSPQPNTRKLGDIFIRNRKHLMLKAPSVLMPEEWNIILNPLHPEMEQVKIVSQRPLFFTERFKTNLI